MLVQGFLEFEGLFRFDCDSIGHLRAKLRAPMATIAYYRPLSVMGWAWRSIWIDVIARRVERQAWAMTDLTAVAGRLPPCFGMHATGPRGSRLITSPATTSSGPSPAPESERAGHPRFPSDCSAPSTAPPNNPPRPKTACRIPASPAVLPWAGNNAALCPDSPPSSPNPSRVKPPCRPACDRRSEYRVPGPRDLRPRPEPPVRSRSAATPGPERVGPNQNACDPVYPRMVKISFAAAGPGPTDEPRTDGGRPRPPPRPAAVLSRLPPPPAAAMVRRPN
jgi:hypothetical protein